jgi:hypothetical protein
MSSVRVKQITAAADNNDKTLRLQGGRLEAKMFPMKGEAGSPRSAPLPPAKSLQLY